MRRTQYLMLHAFLFTSILLSYYVQASHGSLEDCYSCSKKDSGNRFICNYGTKMEENKIACCSEESRSNFCKSKPKYNKCSRTFNEMGGSFFNYCPSAREQKCGTMRLEASSGKQEISSSEMRYSVAGSQYDACYYVIQKNNFTHYNKNGNILLKLKEMKNVVISLHRGRDALDIENESLIGQDQVVSIGSTYQVENTDGIVVSVHVTQENLDSSFSFEYWTDVEADFLMQIFDWFKNLGVLKWFLAGCLVLCCCGFCIKRCIKKKRIHDGLPELEVSTLQNLQKFDQFGLTEQVDNAKESLGNGDDTQSQDEWDFNTRKERVIKKEGKNSRNDDIAFQRTNPFAQVKQKKEKDKQIE